MKPVTSTETTSSINQEIQVAANNLFHEKSWRAAISYFLNEIWRNHSIVMDCPKINFSGITLRLDMTKKVYYVYGKLEKEKGTEEALRQRSLRKLDGRTLEVSWDQAAVEVGLVRFAKDKGISQLIIRLPKNAKFSLQKTTISSEYIIDGSVGVEQLPLPELSTARRFYGLDIETK